MSDLRAALEDLLRVAFRDEDFLTQNSVPMDAPPGVRRALRKARAALTAPSTPEPSGLTEHERLDQAHALGYREGYRTAASRAAPSTEPALDVELLVTATEAILGDGEVSTRDGSEGTDRAARMIAAEYARLAESQS